MIYFFPGVGADDALAAYHPMPDHEVHWVRWPKNLLALRFTAPAQPGCPVFSIHGQRDRMIRASGEKRDQLVAGGGHLISMTHTGMVNEKLLHWVQLMGGRDPLAGENS